VIGFTAGLGEEMLFRGVVQTAFVNQIGIAPALAIGIAAIVFGLMHFVTLTYVVLAAAAGFYLGWLYHLSGQLVLPILVHGLYDSLAFIYLVRRAQRKNGPATNGQNR
jgi:membrane protease YdiL (CAAX protease family)